MRFDVLPEIAGISDKIFETVWAVRPHQSRHHELLHVVKGRMELAYEDGSRFQAAAGDTLFNVAGVMHRDVFELDEEVEIFFISFSWAAAGEFFRQVDNRKLKQISPQADAEIKRLFDVMRYDTGAQEIDHSVANARLLNILLLFYREAACPSQHELRTGKRKLLVNKAKGYIDRHFRDPIRLEDVAEHLQVSTFYISRIFSSESDFSLVEYLTERRLNEAKKLLADGRHSVAEVARMAGYEDSNYFSKVFKRRVGCPPGKYR